MEREEQSGDSGHVSRSLSRACGLGEETLLAAAAQGVTAGLLPDRTGLEIQIMEKSLEDLLTRVDEFVGMLDMIRSDSSQIVNESVPQIHTKAAEMRSIYTKIDMLETFVKTLGNNVAVMEEHVAKAETSLGSFPNPFRKLLRTINVPPFLTKSASARHQQTRYETPVIFKTEDYFPNCSDQHHT